MAEKQFQDGALSGEDDYSDGQRDGPWRRWHDNGNLLDEGTCNLGKKTGEWITFNKVGEEVKRGVHR
ncbi:toxin-antitoxin system YwqK family antitoxin [Streptomyces atratus]|uniref:toxin-antitoxin system YwqK family antitoxin n=1 Tax=Streptomyces atratus TaxID=1893 RepID=UPI00365BD60A